MLFPSFPFLVFFAVVFAGYWSLRNHRARLGWLLAASCFFYMSWNPWLITLILFSASVDYGVALLLDRAESRPLRRGLLLFSVSVNLGLLAYFKYTNFFLNSVIGGLNAFGLGLRPPLVEIVLPLGISFYTFETISYIVDVYRRRQKPVRNLLDYAVYILFFPHLVAGPIVRPEEFLPQLKHAKRWSWARVELGTRLFLMGLFKKAVIADNLASIADMVFAKPAEFGSLAVWIGVLSYSAQIYCDFSGYSDMAVGLAHTFGFKLPCNFRMPYLASDISDFWRRWHITLSTWLRDYLYVPLGGNRHGTRATYRNLVLTMFLGGLWHGADWTFAIWGLYHGGLLALHKAIRFPAWCSHKALRPLFVMGTFLFVSIGWVFFRAQRPKDALLILQRMFQPIAGERLTDLPLCTAVTFLMLVFAGHLLPRIANRKGIDGRLPVPALGVGLALVAVLVQLLVPEENQAFIYFQF